MSRYSPLNPKYLLLAVCCSVSLSLGAQNPLADLGQVNRYYRSLRGFSVNVAVDLYAGPDDATPAKRMTGSVQTAGTLVHSLFDGRESIVGTDFILVADHGNRSVYYAPRDKKSQRQSVTDGSEVLDSTFLARYRISQTQAGTYKLTPTKSGGEYRQIGIRVDTQNHILREISYLYAGQVRYARVVVSYTDFTPNPQPDKTPYTELKFLTGRQKNARLQPAFSSYQLINSFTYDPKKNLIEQ